MTKRNQGLNVTVSGINELMVKTGAAVISDALNGSGFRNVSAVSLLLGGDPQGQDPNAQALPSAEVMLTRLRHEQPELLDEPVLVQYFETDEQPERDQISEPDLRPDLSDDPVLADGPGEDELSPAQDEALERDVETDQ